MTKKTVAINALSLLWGGGQVYLSNILRYADQFPDIKIYVFAPPQFSRLYAFPTVDIIPCHFAAKSLLHRSIWGKYKMPRVLASIKADILFCPGGTIGFYGTADVLTAVTFQNMLILDENNRRKYGIGYMRLRLKLLEKIASGDFERADLIIFISNYAKKIVDQKIHNKKGISVVTYHGLDNAFKTGNRKDIPRIDLLPKEEYLLYVSVIDVFKAHIEVIRAYNILCQNRHTEEKLLLVGPEYFPYAKRVRKEIQRLGLDGKVIVLGNIPYVNMPSVYHHAKAHIFASTCENCPNVVLESLGSGRPLFLSNKPPMPELAGDAAVYFDPHDPNELADLLLQYLDNDEWAKQMGKKVFERSLFYNWEVTAKKTFQAFGNLLETKMSS